VITTGEELHHITDELPGDQAELARALLDDLRDAADQDGAPLDLETVASPDRGIEDVAQGFVEPLDQYKRERGM
jgi:hypothetical protein